MSAPSYNPTTSSNLSDLFDWGALGIDPTFLSFLEDLPDHESIPHQPVSESSANTTGEDYGKDNFTRAKDGIGFGPISGTAAESDTAGAVVEAECDTAGAVVDVDDMAVGPSRRESAMYVHTYSLIMIIYLLILTSHKVTTHKYVSRSRDERKKYAWLTLLAR